MHSDAPPQTISDHLSALLGYHALGYNNLFFPAAVLAAGVAAAVALFLVEQVRRMINLLHMV